MDSLETVFRKWCGWVEPCGEEEAAHRLRLGDLGIPRWLLGSKGPAIVVSACLIGIRSRYDGRSNRVPGLLERLRRLQLEVIPLCPEYLAGLGVPRPTIHFLGGDGAAFLQGASRVVDAEGRDRTASFALGVRRALGLARGAVAALLKESSPSCGLHRVHVDDGYRFGLGAWAAGLRHTTPCFSEKEQERFWGLLGAVLTRPGARAGT